MASPPNRRANGDQRDIIDQESDGERPHASPSDRSHDDLHQPEAVLLARQAIVEGYQDAISGRAVEFRGSLSSAREKARRQLAGK